MCSKVQSCGGRHQLRPVFVFLSRAFLFSKQIDLFRLKWLRQLVSGNISTKLLALHRKKHAVEQEANIRRGENEIRAESIDYNIDS